MARIELSASMRSPGTPEDVEVTTEPRVPVTDPTLGIPVARPAPWPSAPTHRLVTIGDSLTHGFQSGAIYNTDLSYPAIVARELGWYDRFRRPTYNGFGGLPLNLELLIRELEREFGDELSWWELPLALFRARNYLDQVEDWWERGPGSVRTPSVGINHNLGVYGWDLRDALVRTADLCAAAIDEPRDQLVSQIVEHANERAAIRVLDSARAADGTALTPLQAAAALGTAGGVRDDGSADLEGDGIETLIVLLGGNNALKTVTELRVVWSEDDGFQDLTAKERYTVWRPTHFARELDLVVAEVKRVRARHVIWGTVPHVTIAPIARGVGTKVRPDSRYFPFYTRPWIADPDFDHKDDPCITEQDARAVDSAIDQYNDAITAAVRAAREEGRDWYLLDTAGMLDRLASRRYIDSPAARPDWWRPYDLPPELAMLNPVPDSRYLVVGPNGRERGGLFSLDGVHPTTIGYGLLAQEFVNVMQLAGVRFFLSDGRTERVGPVRVDFARLLALDTLVSHPPASLTADLHLVGWVDERLDVIRPLLRKVGVALPEDFL